MLSSVDGWTDGMNSVIDGSDHECGQWCNQSMTRRTINHYLHHTLYEVSVVHSVTMAVTMVIVAGNDAMVWCHSESSDSIAMQAHQ